MCGRFALANPRRLADGLLDALDVAAVAPGVDDPVAPRFNVAPSQDVLTVLDVRRDGERRRTLAPVRWGLVPSWARERSIGHRLANARAEGIEAKPAFRGAWSRGRRAAVLADAFYEWSDVRDEVADPRNGDEPGTPPSGPSRRPVARSARPRRQPWAIRLAGGAPFAFAALWDSWRDPAAPDAPPLVSCTLVTTAPNPLVATIHDRMPVILTGDALRRWLSADTAPDEALALLAAYPAEHMEAWPVSPAVNTPAHDEPAVLEPVGPVRAG